MTYTGTWQRALVAAALGVALAAQAQQPATPAAASANPVLKGAEVTESALIDALAVEGPQGPADATMRGFRAPTAGGAPAKPAGPGRASLLITFATNSTEVSPETQATLDVLARALQSDKLAGNSFRVEGHADARGNPERNLELSQLRAEAVAAYLVSKHGILPERLQAQGKGSAEPLNKERVDAPENRRVTIVTVRN
jgi:OOP family OmpA-OmpF porin